MNTLICCAFKISTFCLHVGKAMRPEALTTMPTTVLGFLTSRFAGLAPHQMLYCSRLQTTVCAECSSGAAATTAYRPLIRHSILLVTSVGKSSSKATQPCAPHLHFVPFHLLFTCRSAGAAVQSCLHLIIQMEQRTLSAFLGRKTSSKIVNWN